MKHWQQVTQEEMKKWVPDIEGDIQRLQKKLEIATKALNMIYHDMKCWTFISKRDARVLSVICEALNKMEEV